MLRGTCPTKGCELCCLLCLLPCRPCRSFVHQRRPRRSNLANNLPGLWVGSMGSCILPWLPLHLTPPPVHCIPCAAAGTQPAALRSASAALLAASTRHLHRLAAERFCCERQTGVHLACRQSARGMLLASYGRLGALMRAPHHLPLLCPPLLLQFYGELWLSSQKL